MNDWARSVCQTSDGGYIVVGYSKSNDGDVTGNHGDFDYWVIKVNSTGDLQWQKSYGGSGFDNAYSVIQTHDGNYVVAGFTESNDGDVSGNHGLQDYWIIKLDPNGNLLWQKTVGGSSNEQAACVIENSDFDFVVVGYAKSGDGDVTDHKGSNDIWVVKLSTDGEIKWKKCYGGSKNDSGRWLEQTPDGGYIITGYSASKDKDVTVNKGNMDFWLLKIDANGAIQWQKSYGGSQDDYPYILHRCSNGIYTVCGYTQSNDGDVTSQHGLGDYWVIAVDSVGNLLWQQSFGGSQFEEARSIIPLSGNRYLISGYSPSTDGDVTGSHGGSDGWMIKTTATQLKLTVSSKDVVQAEVWPNPAQSSICISKLSDKSDARVSVTLYNDWGQALLSRKLVATSDGSYRLELDHSIPDGNFYLRIEFNDQVELHQIQIKH